MRSGHDRRRVAFFSEVGLVGGAERFLRDVIHGLDRERYDVELLCAANSEFTGFVRDYECPQPYRVRELDIRTLANSPALAAGRALKSKAAFYRWREVPKGVIRQAQNLRNWRVIRRALESRPIDILHINNGGYPGGESCRLAAIAAWHAGIPVRIMTCHNIAEALVFPMALERLIDARVSRSLHTLVAVSQVSAQSLRERRGFPPRQLRVVHLGIPDPPRSSEARLGQLRSELGIDAATKVVGVVGGFEPRKGHEVLVRCMPQVATRLPTLRVVFVGEGERRESLEALAGQLGVADRIVFTGYRRDATDIIDLVDVLALPSVAYESLPYVVLEAMALAKPVVASSIGGVPEEIEDGVTGKLVPPGDPSLLGEALMSVLLDRERAVTMGREGRRKYIGEFALSRMLLDIERLYDAGLGQEASTQPRRF